MQQEVQKITKNERTNFVMNKTKITKRIIILAVLCIAALFVFTSCGSNAVNTNDGKWKDIFGTATVDPDEELESGESSSGDESTSEESSSEDESDPVIRTESVVSCRK